MIHKLRFLFFLLIAVVIRGNAQQINEDSLKHPEYYRPVDVEDFNAKLAEQCALNAINAKRRAENADSIFFNTILQNAAEDQAAYMADKMTVTSKNKGKKKTLAKRIKYYGGSTFGEELLAKVSPKNGKLTITYKELGERIAFRVTKNRKTLAITANPKFVFAGIGARLQEDKKKLFVSFVLGNYDSFNEGASRREEMDLPYSKRRYCLKPVRKAADKKLCKKINKYKKYFPDIQRGLYIKDGKVYLEYDNLRMLRKIVRGSRDGLAVDIVQRKQYACGGANIVDNNLVNRGIMLKKMWSPKMVKHNLITDKKLKKKKIKVVLAKKLPKGFDPDNTDYELNLLIIKSKRVCCAVNHTPDVKGNVEYRKHLAWLADTISDSSGVMYKPVAETNELVFKIPFQRSKYDYNPADIEPFINKLNEPDFIINSLSITAYSSIEGSDAVNKKLQKKRAGSIVEALKSRQEQSLKPTIKTGYNWDDFVRDLQGTEYENLTTMSLSEAQKYIRTHHLTKKMEPYLEKHRYALIKLKITYDISTIQKEQKYVVSRFNKAIENNDYKTALQIQKYIFKKVVNKEYDSSAVIGQIIPETKATAGLAMNKLWLEQYLKLGKDSYCQKINLLHNLAPENYYISYNDIYCRILNNNVPNDSVDGIQSRIDAFYGAPLDYIGQKPVDALNIELQLLLIQNNDTTDEISDFVTARLEKLKKILKIGGNDDWTNALKLSSYFVEISDYDFSAKLLEPFIYYDDVNEDLLFKYIDLSSYSDGRVFSNRFYYAMKKAQQLNPKRFCQLITDKHLSFQIFRNTLVKELYCKKCHDEKN